MFVYVRSVFDVIKTHINNIDEENGYCVMMVLTDSKNVIKIFLFFFFVFSFYYSSSFFAVVFNKISRKQKKEERIDSAVYVWENEGKAEEKKGKK